MNRRVVHDAWGKGTHKSRYLAVFYGAGGILGLVGLLAPHGPQVRELGVGATASCALLAAGVLVVWGQRFPDLVMHGFVALGTAIIASAMYFGDTAETSGTTAIFFVWIALYAFTFFDGPSSWIQILVAAMFYALYLARVGDHDNVAQWITTAGTLAVTGYVVGRLAHHNTQLAGFDGLSGLPNRRSFDRTLTLELERATREDVALSVAVLDINNFKRVNDSLGHIAGDELLRICAERIVHCLRPHDFLARLGGDEFALILPGPSATELETIAQRIASALSEPITMHDMTLNITASIGFATAADNTTATELLRNADLAMYVAKSSGVRHFDVYHDSMHDEALARLELESDLREAVAHRAIEVAFQPIVSITTGQCTAIELLARWHHPTRGAVPPDEFIAIAERIGVIRELGEQVFTHACRIATVVHKTRPDLDITVNVSPAQLSDPTLADRFGALLRASAVNPKRLVLEVTENALMQDVDAAAERLRELKTLGVRVAVDDFGVGHSSLSYLRKFPVDVLKLDKSFIASLHDGGGQLARAVIQLGALLGLDVIAEGIESKAQLDELTTFGCASGQGYLFASPMTQDELLEHLKTADQPATPPQALLNTGYASNETRR
jgi:diguanylate cyclase (GGDEF)-like protein